MAGLKDFFIGVGKMFKSMYGVIKKTVPEEVLVQAIQKAEEAAIKFIDNADKREFVVRALMGRFKIPEYVARLATEMAVAAIKNGVHKAGDKAEEGITDEPDTD